MVADKDALIKQMEKDLAKYEAIVKELKEEIKRLQRVRSKL